MLRPTPAQFTRNQFARHASSTPTIAQASFWKSLIPKPLRRRPEQPGVMRTAKKPKSMEWNPATFFIIIFLFIGSMSIQMIALKKDFSTFSRRAEVRIGLLREVVEKLQRGQEVDVEKTLGTGDEAKEKEWEEVLREIERDDILKNPRKGEKTKQASPAPATPEAKVEAKTESAAPAKVKTASYSNFF
ncbi:hypothetical protein DL766_004524 [Monosporascus sp. MC13-8B]|uniref:Uncharacterized protein n=1 Tax=Monosporascus cannonballus TaxID=155416 RepID=A0ABY0H4C5_9PEZI|nr:hypothetical protein DL763_011340 [Monosporascus cannonballus]RYO84523.1 hypothetical protein DL762_005629 [Monosporascus cannonballus]RYP31216.1 hypothetical protein DL766_004524 [Monosporascus sp. MC13-8B]